MIRKKRQKIRASVDMYTRNAHRNSYIAISINEMLIRYFYWRNHADQFTLKHDHDSNYIKLSRYRLQLKTLELL